MRQPGYPGICNHFHLTGWQYDLTQLARREERGERREREERREERDERKSARKESSLLSLHPETAVVSCSSQINQLALLVSFYLLLLFCSWFTLFPSSLPLSVCLFPCLLSLPRALFFPGANRLTRLRLNRERGERERGSSKGTLSVVYVSVCEEQVNKASAHKMTQEG